jgi:hypothetical protein
MAWVPLTAGVNGPVSALVALPDGGFVAGGDFTEVGGLACSRIATYRERLSITRNSAGSTICAGAAVTLSVDVAGLSPQFQWRRNGEAIAGASAPTLTIDPATISDTGIYDCVVLGACGDIAVTSPAMLIVIPPPAVATQPVDQGANPDTPVSFFVQLQPETLCTRPRPFSHRWERRNPAVADPASPDAWIELQDGPDFVNTRTSALLILRPIPALATGYRCRITGGCDCGTTYTDVVNFSIGCPADFNADGGVDFSDIEAFFMRWENGC